jgi:hypothetical protein
LRADAESPEPVPASVSGSGKLSPHPLAGSGLMVLSVMVVFSLFPRGGAPVLPRLFTPSHDPDFT